MSRGPLNYHASDERPEWVATIAVNGVTEDLSSGFTFLVTISKSRLAPPSLVKTVGITGAADGVVTVEWRPNDLALIPGPYIVQLITTRTSDGHEWTVQETMIIKARLASA